MLNTKIPVAILGATGMVGQRFLTLLENHPWFEVVDVAASQNSAGKTYENAVTGRWKMNSPIPAKAAKLILKAVVEDMDLITSKVKIAFCALDMDKHEIMQIEEKYAAKGVAVISNNSAHRWTEDIPMLMPEINPTHVEMINVQRKNRNWTTGLIAVKPNCSIQSYVPALDALKDFGLEKVIVTTCQAISGAGKTFKDWPEIEDNVIPFISGEEEKSEQEPLRIWGKFENYKIELAKKPAISANCLRVPVSDGHMATVNFSTKVAVTAEQIIEKWENYINPIAPLNLPSSPKKFLNYFDEPDRPQTHIDRERDNGMGISIGRLKKDPILGWRFVSLSHNTIRGAAGGAILTAELLVKKGYIV